MNAMRPPGLKQLAFILVSLELGILHVLLPWCLGALLPSLPNPMPAPSPRPSRAHCRAHKARTNGRANGTKSIKSKHVCFLNQFPS